MIAYWYEVQQIAITFFIFTSLHLYLQIGENKYSVKKILFEFFLF